MYIHAAYKLHYYMVNQIQFVSMLSFLFIDVYYTCKAQSTISRNYHSLSVIITFTYNVTTAAKQFELECIATDVWDGRAGSVMNVSESFNYTTITARTDCSSCTNTAGNDYHCEGQCCHKL